MTGMPRPDLADLALPAVCCVLVAAMVLLGVVFVYETESRRRLCPRGETRIEFSDGAVQCAKSQDPCHVTP